MIRSHGNVKSLFVIHHDTCILLMKLLLFTENIREEVVGDKLFECSMCHLNFNTLHSLAWHMLIHDMFKCGLCAGLFKTPQDLLGHLNVHKNGIPENYLAALSEGIRLGKPRSVLNEQLLNQSLEKPHSIHQKQDQVGHKRASSSWEKSWEDNYKTKHPRFVSEWTTFELKSRESVFNSRRARPGRTQMSV